MAQQDTKTNEQNNPESQGREMTRSPQPRRGAYSPLLALTTGDIFRMNPFSVMSRMTEEMDRVFDELAHSRGAGVRTAWSPAIEVSERDGNYLVRAELPGLNPGDVKLEITDDAIVLQGERKIEHEETRGDIHLTERRYGQFYRAIPLPERSAAEEARAKYENGILEVTVPLREQRNNRREIPIETGSPAAAESSQKAA